MISGNLEYLMASLPYLSFEDSAEARSKVFSVFQKYAGPKEAEKSMVAILDDQASRFMGRNKFQIFSQINLGSIHSISFRDSTNAVLSGFANYVFELKKELRDLRITRRKDENTSKEKQQQLPIRPGNPLEEEVQLLQLQWNRLDALSIGHYSDFSALVNYKLKLLLLIRWWNFDAKKGFDLFEQTTKND